MIKKIYPSVEDCKIKNYVECNEKGCTKVFKSDSNLNLHLAKTHGKTKLLESNNVKQYHCPETHCVYHQGKYLKNMKLLRQHYLKVHTNREHTCDKCQKSFTSDKSFQAHFPYCGVKFSCCDCSVFYPSYESLQTHGRRKSHRILSKQEYTAKVVSSCNLSFQQNEQFILPKHVNVILISNSNFNESVKDQCIQTLGNPQIINEISKNKDLQIIEISQQAQAPLKSTYVSVETQTEENFINKFGLSNVKKQKMASTQTDLIEVVKVQKKIGNEVRNTMNSSGTQTAADLNFNSSTDKIQCIVTNNASTLVEDSAFNNANNFEFDNCHMETQTDFIFDDDIFGNDYLMSNMYTQTCDDYLNQFNFNDNQTQTVFDDVMISRSVESQTFISPRLQNNYACKDMSHTETQTDAEFRQMLEVINS